MPQGNPWMITEAIVNHPQIFHYQESWQFFSFEEDVHYEHSIGWS